MMTGLLLAVAIAFPGELQKLPPVDQVYVIGSADGDTNVVVCGRNVAVTASGAWATMVDVVPGTNVITAGAVSRSIVVEPKSWLPSLEMPRVYKKLEYAGDVAKPHPHRKRKNEITVVVDAGHGGDDQGAISPHGYKEKDANLMMAKAVKRALELNGFRVVMTRDDDRRVELYDRPKVAHANDADAFISIHHNAPAHNRNPLLTRYHSAYAWNPIGEALAKAINARMGEALNKTLPNHGVIHANFAVTRNPEIPSCLVEIDFMTSPEGETEIFNEASQRRTAAAIADGFYDWYRQDALPL